MTGTIRSSTLTVACLRRTITAASATSATVDQRGGMWKAFSNEDEMELAVTWLMPHQQTRPDSANREAITERRRPLPSLTNKWCR